MMMDRPAPLSVKTPTPAVGKRAYDEDEEEGVSEIDSSSHAGEDDEVAPMKKRKKPPRPPFDVAKGAYDRDAVKADRAKARFISEIANRAQTRYKEGVIKPAVDKPGKILVAFRDNTSRSGFIATQAQLDELLRVETFSLKVFDVVLKKGRSTQLVDTLKMLHITGMVQGEDPDQYPMGGHLPPDADDGYYYQAPNPLSVEELTFWLEINGERFNEEGSIEEMFYFLINKKAAGPFSRKRDVDDDDGAPDGARVVFDKNIVAEKCAGGHGPPYNLCRDQTIMMLGNYLSFLHADLEEQMGHRTTFVSLPLIKRWLATQMWTHVY